MPPSQVPETAEPLFEILEKRAVKFCSRFKKKKAEFYQVAESGQSFYAAMMVRNWTKPDPIWIACAHIKVQENVLNELPLWGVENAMMLPEYEWAGFDEALPDPESAAERLAVLKEVHERRTTKSDQPLVIVICGASFEEDAPAPNTLTDHTALFKVGEELNSETFVGQLEGAGYESSAQVFRRGQYAVRGGIIDVFAYQGRDPVRIELFGDEIDSIRVFDVDSQTSVEKVDSTEVLLSEANLEQTATLADYVGKNDLIINIDAEVDDAHVHISAEFADDETDATPCYANPVGTFEAGDFVLQEQKRADFASQLAEWRRDKWTVAMSFNSIGEKERFSELVFADAFEDGFLKTMFGSLARGFTIPEAKIAVLSDAEIFGRYQNHRSRRRYKLAQKRVSNQQQASLREFNYGDLVVHSDYGIGKFRGIKERENDTRNGIKNEEVMEIEYAEFARLYVPLDQAHLVSRYVGSGKNAPKLSRLGDQRWSKTREKTEKSILEYAERLLQIQAERETQTGFAHPPDNKWQWEFENAFIYKETSDQLRAIEATKEDMEQPGCMDRLVCGDVGFGKTEVAIRAAFKAMMSGKQVAMLAPTTVLADQHYHNFRERMSDFPVKIELLSRYRSPAEQRKTVEGLANGTVDMVIGTHRLISKDVRYKDLGLVVIDEEQRFGVSHKERFKEIFRFVDVLTLSATPIPRTLYLSLMGVKEMSTIDTPPPNRRAVATSICPYDEKVIRSAVEKELAREGQVFFLHNRVKTIRGMRTRIQKLVPGARVEIGHGQMANDELEDVMKRFINHECDVLVCTTIIESGVDIPNANTIIIDRADRFGLADLYQLRGRVGRADRRAYAYLMLPEDMLTGGDAQKRINAIKQYSSLGAGFKIAMRDLEIRGAGNLLGTQQSGHIAAIGFDLYCQLLKQSVSKLKGEPSADRCDMPVHIDFLCTNETHYQRAPGDSLPGYIPADYMPEARLRITAYRELAEVSRLKELDELRQNWRDRFGRPPVPTENLLRCTELKVRAALNGFGALEINDRKLMLTKKGNYLQINGKFPRLDGDTPEEWLEDALELVKSI
ncbi:MAG: transcription-repair coupling factor [Verrucomicrobiales bacterium]